MSLSLARHERAFERVYKRHVGQVYRYALAVVRDPAEAEEVTFATFRRASRGLRGAKEPRLELNSLLAIAHEICRVRGDYQRLVEADFLGEDELITAADVRRALGRLPFDQRAVLVMREVEGRSCGEIAEILARSNADVESLLFRARRALREELDGSLTCREAEFAISRQLDDRLSRSERRLLRAHLRSCEECVAFARYQQAERTALRSLATAPLPARLTSPPTPTASFLPLERLLR